jgi:hypothetical protein
MCLNSINFLKKNNNINIQHIWCIRFKNKLNNERR